ncbi:MAG: 1-deoxy-D-xylulose-5-phosphate reductoisomerase [Candidatus Eremiobacteraeota bacterium]|nr:1-deoxy-D-xylulose-5-phosphate reductoisomerase [Candidatus Eremiobacteraeota bacterium]
MRRVAILGSTGSVGRQTLEVIASQPDAFSVVALAANRNVELLAEQANRFRVPLLALSDAAAHARLEAQLAYAPRRTVTGPAALAVAALEAEADVVLAATDGMSGLHAVAACLQQGVHVALANKELLVAAGAWLRTLARGSAAPLIPVDSEHSALFQCLLGERRDDVACVVITASGGPFWSYSVEQLAAATPEAALAHPIWSMGAKNSIDSATLMNKGLEVIEACHLFELRPEQVEVVVHRQSIMHGCVIFRDGSVKAQLAAPDMRLPIGFALSYPRRADHAIALSQTRAAIGLAGRAATLSFEPVDEGRFPSLGLAYGALRAGKTYPAVLSAANEEAGRAFLRRQIKFTEICAFVEQTLAAHTPAADGLAGIEDADRWSRAYTRETINAARRT